MSDKPDETPYNPPVRDPQGLTVVFIPQIRDEFERIIPAMNQFIYDKPKSHIISRIVMGQIDRLGNSRLGEVAYDFQSVADRKHYESLLLKYAPSVPYSVLKSKDFPKD